MAALKLNAAGENNFARRARSRLGRRVALNPLSPARRVRRIFMSLALMISILAFIVIGADVLFVQWIEGRASALFIFGTACLIAAGCTALFAVVAVVGLMISSAFSDDPS